MLSCETFVLSSCCVLLLRFNEPTIYILCRRFTIESSTAVMGRNSNYLGIASRPSFGKFPSSSSSHRDHIRAKTPSNFLNHQLSRQSKHHHLQSNYNRHTSKMSSSKNPSLKRPNDDEDDPARSGFKKQCIEVTGLEQDSPIEEITPRATSTITESEIGLYVRRRKVLSCADRIRRRKAMVSPKSITHVSNN